jgi:potassium-transporting ATPase KdpC subunit
MFRQIIPAFRFMFWLTVLTGIVYPLVVTGLCQELFPHQANGSMVTVQGRAVGSALLGQDFTQPGYFQPRPSAAGNGYDGLQSGGSNLGADNPALVQRVSAAETAFRKANPEFHGPIPADLLTASGSGLDPDLSPAAALAQAPRVAAARHLAPATVEALVEAHITGRQWGFLGEPRVNVLQLNLALDRLTP